MLVCLCQSFKQLVANDRTTNFRLLASTYHDDARVSVFSLFFPFFPFLFTLQIYLLYKLLRHCVDIQVCLLLTIFAPDVSTPLVSPLSQLHTAFHSSKVQFTSAELTISFIQVEMRETFFPTAQTSLSPFLSRSLSLSSSRTILTKRFCIYRKKRERSFTEKVTLSLFLSLYDSFVSIDATIFSFFFLEIYLSAAEADLQVGMYTTLYLPTRYKKFYALYMRIALCTQNFTRRRRGSTTSRLTFSSRWKFVLPFVFLFASFFISQVMINITDLSPVR